MAPQLSLLSLKLYSLLKPLLPTLLWLILGIFPLLLHPLITSFLELKFFIMTFSMPSLAMILGRLSSQMESLLLFSKTLLPNSLPAWSNAFAYVSLLLPIILAASLLTFNLSLKRVTAPILLTTTLFPISLVISKAFGKVWHKSLISKLPFYELYPSLCTFISSFLSDRFITPVVSSHCSSTKTIKSGVPQDSLLSPTLFIIHQWSSKSNSMPYPLLCWWYHLVFFNVVQQIPNPIRIK